ncbi:MAG TPA: 50S ribosomal L9 C-terminal domain-containing protein, partial [Terriglobia bacterium]|nr:50S ribosomal L9 C-terminal domain-containing protein [Terriglobia bacterium]
GLVAQGYHIDRRKIQLGAPLKVIGEYDVPVKLHRDVTATIKVKVEGQIEPGTTPAAKPDKAASAPPTESPAAPESPAAAAAPGSEGS